MSIICCIYTPEGIVMAADSRFTKTKTDDTNPSKIIKTTYTSSDNGQKVFLLNKTEVGISFCGNAMINDLSIADYIRQFEIDKIEVNDTVEIVAQKLCDQYEEDETAFFVVGYIEDEPYVFQINAEGLQRLNASSITSATENQKKLNIIYSAAWNGQKTAITKIMNDAPILNVDWVTMPLKDSIDFAEFLVDATIKYEHFSNDIQTCGGDIDILVLTKDRAFWKQHKIYNPK